MWCLGHVLECDEKMFLNGSTFFPYKSILRGGLGGVFVQERVTMVTIKDSSLQLTAYSLQGTCFRNIRPGPGRNPKIMNHSQRPSLRNTSEGSQKETKFLSRNQFLRRILARSCSEDGSCPQTKRGESRGAQECRSVGGSPRLARSNSHFLAGQGWQPWWCLQLQFRRRLRCSEEELVARVKSTVPRYLWFNKTVPRYLCFNKKNCTKVSML